jgi:hypothetical protein
MPLSKLLLIFVAGFVLLYGLLMAPWPGWNAAYGAWFRGLGELAFTRTGEQRIVRFEPYFEQHGFSSLTTRIILGNRDLTDNAGRGPVRRLDLDTRSIGWTPTALTIALILATPLPWRRRAWALLWGMLLVHAFILFSIQAWIWNESPDLSLSNLSPFWKEVADNLEYTLITQMGISFSMPVLIWIVATFRERDLKHFSELLAPRS